MARGTGRVGHSLTTLFLTSDDVLRIHDEELDCPLLSRAKLESAVGQCSQTYDETYLYPTVVEQAAALLFCIAKAHAFLDANKRTAWLACVVFLDLNGMTMVEAEYTVVADYVERLVDSSDLNIADVATWLNDRL